MASEILIIADNSANPVFAAADLLSQAEHDELASSILITDSLTFAAAVQKEIAEQLARLKREEIARKSIETYGAIIITRDLHEAAEIANRIAPEHLEIMIRKPKRILSRIQNAGAIFLGEWTPEALGDYAAGPNHTLPTGGTARFSSPLGVYDFIKRSSILSFSNKGFITLAEAVKTIAVEFSLQYRSVVVFGTARLVSDPQEARRVLYGLIKKYFPLMAPGREFREITNKELRATSVYAIRIEEWSGKENWKERADQSKEWTPLDERWFE